eukprot:3019476-Alexandrium_andersonii.AAC.1
MARTSMICYGGSGNGPPSQVVEACGPQCTNNGQQLRKTCARESLSRCNRLHPQATLGTWATSGCLAEQ